MSIAPLSSAVPHFWMIGASPPCKDGHSARPHGGILKKSQVVVYIVMHMGWGILKRKAHSAITPLDPARITTNRALFAQLGTFSSSVDGALWCDG